MEHITLVHKIVWSFYLKTGLDKDDLFQEAYFAYMYALEHYDPTKGSISTFLWIHISNQLTTYLTKQNKIKDPLVDIEILYNMSCNPDTFFDSFTDDAKVIADIVLATTKKFVKLNKDQAIRRIINIMRNRGWSHKRIHYGILNLKLACSNI